MSEFDDMNAIARRSLANRAASPSPEQDEFSAMNAIARKRLGVAQELSPAARKAAIVGQNLAKSPFKLADLPLSVADIIARAGPAHEYDVARPYEEKPIERGLPVSPDIVSKSIFKGLKKAGVDLDYVKPRDALERNIDTASSLGADFLTSGVLGKGVSAASKLAPATSILKPISKVTDVVLGTPRGAKDLAKMTALGTGLGSAMGAAEEMGAPEGLVQSVGLLGPVGVSAGKGALKVAGKGLGVLGETAKDLTKSALSKEHRINKSLEVLKPTTPSAEHQAKAKHVIEHAIKPENMEEVLSNLAGPESSISEGTAATKAKNTGISQLTRARSGQPANRLTELHQGQEDAIREAVANIKKGEHDIDTASRRLEKVGRIKEQKAQKQQKAAEQGVEEHIKGFEDTLPASEAGTTVQSGVKQEQKRLKQVREENTRALREQLERDEKTHKAKNARDYLKEAIKREDAVTSDWLKKIRRNLSAELSGKDKKYAKEYKKKEASYQKQAEKIESNYASLNTKNHPNLLADKEEQIKLLNKLKEADFGQMKKPIDPTMITIGKIAKERTALQKQFNAMKGDPTKANQRRLLKDVITEIDKDLEPFPSEKAYREAYREHSKPINAIEESTSFIDILKQNKGYLNPHTVLPENVPGKYLRSVDRAREMKGLYATQPELKTSFEQHINNDLMQNVFKNGRVDLKALEKWRARNPGAFDLYEGLDTKLKNTTNAQTFLNRVEAANKAAIKKYYKEHTRGVLGETTDKAIRSSFGNSFAQKEKRQKILELLKKDKNAMKGYQNAAIEHFEDHAMKYMNSNTVNQYMKKYERSLQEVLSPEQFKIIKEAQRLISDRAKTTKQMNTVNSSTSANQLTNANLMEIASTGQLKSYIKILSRRFGKFGPVLDSIADTFLTKYNATESQKFFTVLDRALESGPELQKLLLSQPLKDAKSQATFLKHLEDYAKSRAYIVSGVLNKDKESEQ